MTTRTELAILWLQIRQINPSAEDSSVVLTARYFLARKSFSSQSVKRIGECIAVSTWQTYHCSLCCNNSSAIRVENWTLRSYYYLLCLLVVRVSLFVTFSILTSKMSPRRNILQLLTYKHFVDNSLVYSLDLSIYQYGCPSVHPPPYLQVIHRLNISSQLESFHSTPTWLIKSNAPTTVFYTFYITSLLTHSFN